MQGMIHESLRDLVTDEPMAVVDFPDIRNCGDSAIWLGEMAYLREHHHRRPAYVSRMNDFSPEALKRAAPEGPIFIHGGGNFGDVWLGHQKFRERVLDLFPHRRIVQFPQSIHYESDEHIETTKRVIARHKDFVLLVRDEESRAFAEAQFDCAVRLCPDMAFCIGPLRASAAEFPVLAMLRMDRERVSSVTRVVANDIRVEDWITESSKRVRLAKAVGASSALLKLRPGEFELRKLDAAANHRFERGKRQISRGHTIVTDRLHVHICSLLLGRPHAVLDNSYGKIERFMNSFSGPTKLAYPATSVDDAIQWARARASVAAG